MKNCHLCKADYEEVKQRLSMRQVAEYYGCRVNRKGTCLCPFHTDNHPSLKIYENDKGYYCFTCGNGGDVIKFVGRLFHLRNEEACRKLIEDFALPIAFKDLSYREMRERGRKDAKYRELKRFKAEAYRVLKKYWMLLCDASRDPASPHFEEALRELSIIEYRLECIREWPEEYRADREAVRKLGEIERRIAGWDE